MTSRKHPAGEAGDPLRPSDSDVGGDAADVLHRSASGVPGLAGSASAPGPSQDLHPNEGAAGGAVSGDPELVEGDLGAELELAQRQASEHLALAQRVQAEFENFRKRMQRETADAKARAGERIVGELLPVLDNLERAIDHTTAGGDLKELLRGVEMVHAQILDVFTKEGVEVTDPFGQPFDPSAEQAVGQKEDTEVPEGTVVDVYQKGYRMGGKVVRPAMVVVSTGGPHRTEE